MLIKAGADVRAGHDPPIACAVRLEHAGIVELLAKNGALTRRGWKISKEVIREHGLDSMEELLMNSCGKWARSANARPG